MADKTFLGWPFFTDAHRELAAGVETWAERQLAQPGDAGDEYRRSRELVSLLGHIGWLAYTVPAPFGGARDRIDVRSLCLIRETLARFSGLADFAFAMQGLGSGPISLFGSDELRQKYLPAVAAGDRVAAFALTEAESGSDVAAISTAATAHGQYYTLQGSKTWISNAGIADFYVVFARTGEAPGARGLSAFVVDANTPGLRVTEQIKVTSPHPLGSLEFSECRVPVSQRIGDAGMGFKIAMATLDVFRSTVGAAALGLARRALDAALRRTRERHVAGRPLSEYQLIQDKIAHMAVEIDASALLVYRAAWTKDDGAGRVTREAAMAKMYGTESAQRVVDAAVQIFGGLGVVSGSVVEELYREIRPLRIYEGTTEIQKIIIARETLKNVPGDGR